MIDAVKQPRADFKDYLPQKIKKAKTSMTWAGIIMMFIGAAAIYFPMASTLTLSLLVGWLLVFSGVIGSFASFSISGTGPFFGTLLLGLLQTAAGMMFLYNPGMGALSISLIIAFVFMMDGATQIAYAFEIRSNKGWGWKVVGGMVSIFAGIYMVSALPNIAVWIVGFVFGISYLANGLGTFMIARQIDA